MQERRKEKRLPCQLTAELQSLDGQRSVCGLVLDINEGGMRLSSSHYLSGVYAPVWISEMLREMVIVKLQAKAIGEQNNDMTVASVGIVEWRDAQELGIRLAAMMPFARKRLRTVIDELKEGTRI